MRTLTRCIVSITVATGLSGCNTTTLDPIRGYEAFVNQANAAKIVEMRAQTNGAPIKLTLENLDYFVLYTPVPPKSMLPREPSTWEKALDTIDHLAPIAAFTVLGLSGTYTPTPSIIKGATTIITPTPQTTTP